MVGILGKHACGIGKAHILTLRSLHASYSRVNNCRKLSLRIQQIVAPASTRTLIESKEGYVGVKLSDIPWFGNFVSKA